MDNNTGFPEKDEYKKKSLTTVYNFNILSCKLVSDNKIVMLLSDGFYESEIRI